MNDPCPNYFKFILIQLYIYAKNSNDRNVYYYTGGIEIFSFSSKIINLKLKYVAICVYIGQDLILDHY